MLGSTKLSIERCNLQPDVHMDIVAPQDEVKVVSVTYFSRSATLTLKSICIANSICNRLRLDGHCIVGKSKNVNQYNYRDCCEK